MGWREGWGREEKGRRRRRSRTLSMTASNGLWRVRQLVMVATGKVVAGVGLSEVAIADHPHAPAPASATHRRGRWLR